MRNNTRLNRCRTDISIMSYIFSHIKQTNKQTNKKTTTKQANRHPGPPPPPLKTPPQIIKKIKKRIHIQPQTMGDTIFIKLNILFISQNFELSSDFTRVNI